MLQRIRTSAVDIEASGQQHTPLDRLHTVKLGQKQDLAVQIIDRGWVEQDHPTQLKIYQETTWLL